MTYQVYKLSKWTTGLDDVELIAECPTKRAAELIAEVLCKDLPKYSRGISYIVKEPQDALEM